MPRDRTAPRAEMIDAFHSAWIDFGVPDTEPLDESTELRSVIDELAARQEVRTTTKYVGAAQPKNQLVGGYFSFCRAVRERLRTTENRYPSRETQTGSSPVSICPRSDADLPYDGLAVAFRLEPGAITPDGRNLGCGRRQSSATEIRRHSPRYPE